MKKKKILYQSDFSLAKTGFGRVAKALLKHLYALNKYEIVHYCCGLQHSHPELKRTPWKSIGALPDSQEELEALNKDPNNARLASYGAVLLDKVIKEEKPDVYIAAQDIWGVDFAIDKPWFNKINSVIWTTLDSLPILPSAIEKANKIKNYWIWSNFATKALNSMGLNHVKTVHGPVDHHNFFRLSDSERASLRSRNNIPLDAFLIGFVFRNQLRKSVPNLLEGYALWKKSNPQIKNTFLLLHTYWGEGWNIHRLAQEYGIDFKEILTTYICKNCLNYEVKPFVGQELDCKFCNQKKCQTTTSVSLGATENQLNEIYNLMDLYCHPFTSGGQEIPIQEAKFCELITLVTNYSCGEFACEQEAYSLPLEWSEYREHGTEFIKASTKPSSIAKQINKAYNMPIRKRREWGEKARNWAIKNFSVENISNQIESFIDNADDINYDFSFEEQDKDPYFQIPNIEDNQKWLTFMYHNILKMDHVDENDDGHKYWMQELGKGVKRIDIENYFRQVAARENLKNKKMNFEDLLDQNDKGKRVLFVLPENENEIFLSTAIIKSIKNLYKDHNIYYATKPEYSSILEGNPDIFKIIPYIPQMDSPSWLEGDGLDHEGFFEIAFLPHISLNKIKDFIHKDVDKIDLNIK